MARSLFDQDLQIHGSETYNDNVSGIRDATTAEGGSNLEEDLNILRTLLKENIGVTNWYDEPDLSLSEVYEKYFITLVHDSGFDGVTVDGTSSYAFDSAIKNISGHNDGNGSSTTGGVVVESTRSYRLAIRDATTQNAIDDGSGNEVYGKLSYDTTGYLVSFWSNQDGTAVEYSFSNKNIDLAYVALSSQYQNLPWDRFLDTSFHDMAGLIGTVTDDVVVVDNMHYLLNGLTSQAQINDKLDKLGSTANGEGASGVAIEDADNWFGSAADVEAALNNAQAAIGGTAFDDFDFTENNVCTNDLSVRSNLDELDQKWGDLASTANGEGASLVGIEDSSGNFTATNVEDALAELYNTIDDINDIDRGFEELASSVPSGTNYTLPNSVSYTPDSSGVNLDVYYNGQLLTPGASFDYVEVAGSPSTQIQFNFTARRRRTIDVRSYKNT